MKTLLIGVAFFASTLCAQVATLTGRITDPSGAVIPQARVAVRSLDTGISTNVESTAEGYYTIPALPPGRYEVTISKEGFSTVKQSGIELAVQQTARLDLVLQVGALAETVEVKGQAPLLDSENATVGQVIGNRQVTELPLLGRNTYALAMLVPGVRNSQGVNNVVIDQISTVAYSINGQRANSNEFLLDGAPNTAASQNQPVVNANPDMVQEFKVETNSFSAEHGRAAGGVFNVVTKSGVNDLHFSAYEFLRNDKLNANDYFANRSGTQRAPFRFNQFGGTIGGPVVIPKVYDGRSRTFFFVNTEIVRFVQGIIFTSVLPDRQHLTGDLSTARLGDGRLVTVYDPATVTANPAGGFVRSPFPGNVIPAGRIDPVARAYSRLIPAPQVAGAPLGTINYTRADGNRVPKDSYSFRGDHNFTDRNRIFARYSYDDTPYIRAPVFGPELKNIAPTAGPQIFTRWNAVVESTHTFSPTMIGVFRYSASRLINFRRPYSDNFDLSSLGLPAYMREGMVDPISLPAVTITGYSNTGSVPNIIVGGLVGATDYINFGHTLQTVQGTFTKNLTAHTVKFGGEFRAVQFNNLQVGDQATNFSFSPQWTQGPNPNQSSAVAGLGLATFLLGIPAGGVAPVPALALTTKFHGLFVQDSWKVTPKLTVNLGVRWDYETPRTDRFDQLTNFDYQAASPLQAPGLTLRGGLTFVNTGGLPRINAHGDRNNFAPRAGIAYRVNAKTVVRTGGGLFYGHNGGLGGGAAPFGTSGFQASTTIVTSLDGITPIVKWGDPFPSGFNRPTGSRLGLATLLGQGIQFNDRGNVTPYSAQWSFTIQREMPGNILLEAGYAGSRGLHFPENRQFNQLSPEFLSLGDGLRQQVPNPFFGQISVGALAQRNVARAQLLRPYPHFDGVASQAATWASSSYHALEMKAEKRYASGLSILVSYTYSKLLDYGIGPFAGESLGGSTFQNWHNIAPDKSSSILDQTQRFIMNAVYELPFFKSRSGVEARLLGGWQVGGIWSSFSGGPLGINSTVNNTFSQGGGQRPNWNGQNACVASGTPTRWLDGSVFSNPATYSFGTTPRTFNGCRSDGTSQVDFTVTKNTKLRERLNLQVRAEVFNISNSPRFSPPNANFGNPQFGVVNAQSNLPRIVQFGLKLSY
ncbi:MAG: TonB-dependent receptor [Acidobacteria bacterium]|nr:TonB-dependent receptor [Acidobacteriota bacterium]